MIVMTQDRREEPESIAHRIERPTKFANRPPMLSPIVQRALPACNGFPTDHLPEGSH